MDLDVSRLTYEGLNRRKALLQTEMAQQKALIQNRINDWFSPASIFSLTSLMGKLRMSYSVLTGATLGYRLISFVLRLLRK